MLPLILLLALLFPVKSLASDEFTLHQQIKYHLNQSGNANIEQEFELVNNYSQIYAKEYKVIISGTNISDITGFDETGNIVSSIEYRQDHTEVSLKFNQPKPGKYQKTNFNLRYVYANMASKKGNTWEIVLPDFNSLNVNDTTDITLYVPKNFGDLSFTSTDPDSAIHDNYTHTIQYKISPGSDNRIMLVFGNYQIFDFNFLYYLDNDSQDYIKTEIALPPDTNSQKIILSEITPQPENITLDENGNWLASYLLDPNQKYDVIVKGQVKIFPTTGKNQINTENLTIEQNFWPVNDPKIKEISNNLNTPKQIYEYVVKNLSYNYELTNPGRKGALVALENPNLALCTEFTDLFVTLARSKNIPAREIEGYAYSNNPKIKPTGSTTDVLHAWPEYYNKAQERWVAIDPTWAKTTNGIDFFNDLDLNHFTLVIHGADSQYPPPPGSYKKDHSQKTVNVEFSKNEFVFTKKPLILSLPKITGYRDMKLKVYNPNPVSVDNITIGGQEFNGQNTISKLPPYSYQELILKPIPFFQSILPKYQKVNFEITSSLSNQPSFISTNYPPHYLNISITAGIIIIFLSSGGIILTIHKNKKT